MDCEQALEIYKMIAREEWREYRLKNIEKIRERDRELQQKYLEEIREKLREFEQTNKKEYGNGGQDEWKICVRGFKNT